MADTHADLPDAGRIPHFDIDKVMEDLRRAPLDVSGERDNPESALGNLLIALERLGIINNLTTAT